MKKDTDSYFDRHALRQRRYAAGCSQVMLAEGAGCAASTISMLENGRVQPSPVMLAALALALGCETTDLMTVNGRGDR